MIAILSRVPARLYMVAGVALVIFLAFAAYKYQQGRADRAEAALAPAKATVEALDTVATETPIIRQDQAEKEKAVDEIEGSDTRLPDGFGRDLQRVRDGKRDNDTRQP